MTGYKKRNLLIAGLCLVVLVMAIGYAAFSSKLNITGTSEISSVWQLEITNIETTKTNGDVSNISETTYTKDSATFNVGLNKPRDYIYYKIEVSNKGTLAAIAKVGKLNCGGNSAIECGAYADSSSTNIGTNTNLENSRLIIGPGEKEYYNVWVKFSNDVTSQPENTSANITLELTYEQSDVGITHKTEDNCYTGKVLKNGTMSINDYDASCGTDVVIPETIDGYTVTEIADGHYDSTSGKFISAFASQNITSVNLPNTITYIGYAAFRSNKIENLTIPSSVKNILTYAFSGNAISNLTLNEGLVNISDQAFSENKLTSLDIPSTVRKIGTLSFGYNNISNITYNGNPGNINFSGGAFVRNNFIGDSAFIYEFNSDGSKNYAILNSYAGKDANGVSIPSSVTTIKPYAYYSVNQSELTIPSNVTNIDYAAFSQNRLTTLNISDGVTKIDTSAFSDNNLTNVDIPNSVQTIGNNAFLNNNLQTITIGNGIKTIGTNAFKQKASYTGNTTITINKPNGSVSGSPWGATNATVNWIG